MSKHLQRDEAECPFYHGEDPCRIICEGVRPILSIRVELDDADTMARFELQYCCGNWTQCAIARMIWKEYDDIDNIRYMKTGNRNLSGLGLSPLKGLKLWRQFEEEKRMEKLKSIQNDTQE